MAKNNNIGAGGTNLIVNYLPQSMCEKDLYAMFVSIGPVESCRVMKDVKVCFVEYIQTNPVN